MTDLTFRPATVKQCGFYEQLLKESGEEFGKDKLDEFAQLSVEEASAKISALAQRRNGQPKENDGE